MGIREEINLIGVYGTLKRGNHNYTVKLSPLEPIISEFYNLKAKMYTNGRYPMLIKSQTRSNIFLEIYEISDEKLLEIDDLELPFGYYRDQVEINSVGNVWIYFYGKDEPPNEFREVSEGNFFAEKEW